jgi:hypothetical protein
MYSTHECLCVPLYSLCLSAFNFVRFGTLLQLSSSNRFLASLPVALRHTLKSGTELAVYQIRSHIATDGQSESKSYITTDGQ